MGTLTLNRVFLWLVVSCVGEAATATSSDTAPAFVIAPGASCGSCSMAAATAPARSTTGLDGIARYALSIALHQYHALGVTVTAYTVTSEFLSDGSCVTTSGRPITLTTPFSLSRPASVAESAFLLSAKSSFQYFVGFATCEGSINPTPLIEVANTTGSAVEVSPASGAKATTSSSLPQATISSSVATLSATSPAVNLSTSAGSVLSPSPTTIGLAPTAKVAIGVVVPVVALILLSLAAFLWLRHRNKKTLKDTDKASKDTNEKQDQQPYLQQKGELEAEEKRKYELEAAERRYESDGNDRHELRADVGRRQELQGPEHVHQIQDMGTTAGKNRE